MRKRCWILFACFGRGQQPKVIDAVLDRAFRSRACAILQSSRPKSVSVAKKLEYANAPIIGTFLLPPFVRTTRSQDQVMLNIFMENNYSVKAHSCVEKLLLLFFVRPFSLWVWWRCWGNVRKMAPSESQDYTQDMSQSLVCIRMQTGPINWSVRTLWVL